MSLKHKVRIFALLVLYPGLALYIPTHNRNASASDLTDGGKAEPKFGIDSMCNGVEPDSPNPSLSDSPKCCYRPDGNEEEDLRDISETVISASADFSQENVAANLISFITFYALSLSLQRLVAGQRRLLYPFDDLGRHAGDDGAGRDVLRHDRARSDDRTFSDRHARLKVLHLGHRQV